MDEQEQAEPQPEPVVQLTLNSDEATALRAFLARTPLQGIEAPVMSDLLLMADRAVQAFDAHEALDEHGDTALDDEGDSPPEG